MKEDIITIKHHDRDIVGNSFLPEIEVEVPLVIFSHGYNGSGEDFRELAVRLTAENIGAVCYDFCGGATDTRSSLATTEMTLFSEQEDLVAVIDHVKKWFNVDTEKIFLFGGSQGGGVTALTAEEKADEIRGIILLYPAFCIAENWREKFPTLTAIPQEYTLWGMKLGGDFFRSIHDFYVFDHIGTFSNEVLLLHGTSDDVVPWTDSQKADKLYQKSELVLFKGEKHGFSDRGVDEVFQRTLTFVKQLCS